MASVLATARHLLLVMVLAVMGWALVISSLLLWPPATALPHAPAVVVLAGDHGERLSRALVLMRNGVAPTLVLDGAPDDDRARQLCAGTQSFPVTYEVICLLPQPDSTATEARAAAKLGADRHWTSLIVVTTTDHVLRAEMRFRRCFHGVVGVQGAALHAGAEVHIQAFVHEVLGTVAATTFDRAC